MLGSIWYLMPSSTDLKWLSVTLVMIGKMAAACAFNLIFLFCLELYPTQIRSQGTIVTMLFSRGGAIIAPYIISALVSFLTQYCHSFVLIYYFIPSWGTSGLHFSYIINGCFIFCYCLSRTQLTLGPSQWCLVLLLLWQVYQ